MVEVLEASQQLERVARENDLPPEQCRSLLSAYAPSFAAAQEAIDRASGIVVTDVTQVQAMKEARATRLALKDIRVEADKLRKRMKEDSLRTGKAIDGAFNVLKFLVEPVEQRLEDAEKFAEREEARRVASLHAERSERARALSVDPTHYQFGTMNYETWTAFVETATLAAQARADAAKKAEADRIAAENAAAEERERVAAENARLRAEAEAARAEAMRKAKEELDARQKLEQAAAAERRQREQAEREAQRLRDVEAARVRAEREAAEKAAKVEATRKAKEAKAPDAAKLAAYATALVNVDRPKFTGPEASALSQQVDQILADAARRIRALAVND